MRNSAAVLVPGTNPNSSTNSSSQAVVAAAVTSNSTTILQQTQQQVQGLHPKSMITHSQPQHRHSLSSQNNTSLKLPASSHASHPSQQPMPQTQILQSQTQQHQQILHQQRMFTADALQLQHLNGSAGGSTGMGGSVLMGPLQLGRGENMAIQQANRQYNSTTVSGAEIRKQQNVADKEREALYQSFVHHQLKANSNAIAYQIPSTTPTKTAKSPPSAGAQISVSNQKRRGQLPNNINQAQTQGQGPNYSYQQMQQVHGNQPLNNNQQQASHSSQQLTYSTNPSNQMTFDQNQQFQHNNSSNTNSNGGNSSNSVNQYMSIAQQQAAFLTAQQQAAHSQLKTSKQKCPLVISGNQTNQQSQQNQWHMQNPSQQVQSQQQTYALQMLNNSINKNTASQLQEYEGSIQNSNSNSNGKAVYQGSSSLVSSPAKFQIKQRVAYKPKKKKVSGVPTIPTPSTNKNTSSGTGTGTGTRMVISDPAPANHLTVVQNDSQTYAFKKNSINNKDHELTVQFMHSQSLDQPPTTNHQLQYQQESNLDTFTAVATSSSSLMQNPTSSGSEKQNNADNVNNRNGRLEIPLNNKQQMKYAPPSVSTQSVNPQMNLHTNSIQDQSSHLLQYSNLTQQRAKQKPQNQQRPPQVSQQEVQQSKQNSNFVNQLGSIITSQNFRPQTTTKEDSSPILDPHAQSLGKSSKMHSPFQLSYNLRQENVVPISLTSDPAAFTITINEQDDDVLSPQISSQKPLQHHQQMYQQQQQAQAFGNQQRVVGHKTSYDLNNNRSPHKINNTNYGSGKQKVTSPKSGLPGGTVNASNKIRSKKQMLANSRAQSSHGHRISEQNRLDLPASSGKLTSNLIVQNAIANDTAKTHPNQFISDSDIASLIVQQAHTQVQSRRKIPGRNTSIQKSDSNQKRPESEAQPQQQPLTNQFLKLPGSQQQAQLAQMHQVQAQVTQPLAQHLQETNQTRIGSVFHPQMHAQASVTSSLAVNPADHEQNNLDQQNRWQTQQSYQLNVKSQLNCSKQARQVHNYLQQRYNEEEAAAEDEIDHYNYKVPLYQQEVATAGQVSKTLEQNAGIVSRHQKQKNNSYLISNDSATRKPGQQIATILPRQPSQVQQSQQIHGNLITPQQAQSYKGQFRNSISGYEQIHRQSINQPPVYYNTPQAPPQTHQLSQQNLSESSSNFQPSNFTNALNQLHIRPKTSMKSLHNDGPTLLGIPQSNPLLTVSANVSASLGPCINQQNGNITTPPTVVTGVVSESLWGGKQQLSTDPKRQSQSNEKAAFTNNNSSANLNIQNSNYTNGHQHSIERIKPVGQHFTSPMTQSAHQVPGKTSSQNTPMLSQQQVQYLHLPPNTRPPLIVSLKGSQGASTITQRTVGSSASGSKADQISYSCQEDSNRQLGAQDQKIPFGSNINIIDANENDQRPYLQADDSPKKPDENNRPITPAQNRDPLMLLNVQLRPQTAQVHRLSQRLQFNRRFSHHARPLLVIQFQGVLGDFLPNKSDKDNFPSNSHSLKEPNKTSDLSMTINIRDGALDGLKLLSTYFQIVVFSRETMWDGWTTAHGSSQKVIFDKQNMLVGEFFKGHPEIRIDGLYVSCVPPATAQQQFICWEDFSQVYEDFEIYPPSNQQHSGMKSSQQTVIGDMASAYNWCSEKVLHITPLQNQDLCMFPPQPVTTQNLNFKNQASQAPTCGQIDPQGYFMFDFDVQPPVPLINTVPLITESLTEDSSRIEQPPVLVVPNFRLQHARIQLNFMQIARTVMILAVLGQKIERIEQKVWGWTTIREMDFKVQKTMISLQLPNPSQVKHIKQNPNQVFEINSRLEKRLPLKQRVQSGVRREVVIAKQQISRGKISGNDITGNARTQTPEKQRQNDYNNSQHDQSQSKSTTAEKNKAATVNHGANSAKQNSVTRSQSIAMNEIVNQELPQQLKFVDKYDFMLNDEFFNDLSWRTASDYLNQMQPNEKRSILGLHTAQSDLIWRFYKQKIQDQMDINDKLDRRRVLEEKALEQMLSQSSFITEQDSVQEIFEILQKRDTLDNPLTSMMARNLRFFAKLQLQSRKRLRKALDEWRKFVLSTQKANVLETQQISRFIVMGCDYPNHFYQIQQGQKCERHDLVALKQKMKEADLAAQSAFEVMTTGNVQSDCKSAMLPPFGSQKNKLTQRKQQPTPNLNINQQNTYQGSQRSKVNEVFSQRPAGTANNGQQVTVNPPNQVQNGVGNSVNQINVGVEGACAGIAPLLPPGSSYQSNLSTVVSTVQRPQTTAATAGHPNIYIVTRQQQQQQ